ncbi:MAG: hypothetical protein Q4C13_01160 [Clostridia bacterium]|nr:hypothetical protein [Clostridia bacterium]
MNVKLREPSVSRGWLRQHASDIAAYGGLALCVAFFTVLTPIFGESIWSARKLTTLMSDVIVTALLSIGAVFVYALGNMEISIGKQVGLYATLMVLLGNLTGSLLWGTLLSLLIAVFIAVINGAAGELLNIHPIVPSVVFMFILSGVSTIIYVTLGTRNISLASIDHEVFKSPLLMLAALLAEQLLVGWLFNFTRLGKYARAIGANPVAAAQSGVNLLRYKIAAYAILGVCIVFASLFQMGYTGAASDSTGTGFEMNVMVALILGGMPLSGGMRSKISCAVVGAFTFSLLDVGLPMIGVSTRVAYGIKALIFLAVVFITCRKKEGTLPR